MFRDLIIIIIEYLIDFVFNILVVLYLLSTISLYYHFNLFYYYFKIPKELRVLYLLFYYYYLSIEKVLDILVLLYLVSFLIDLRGPKLNRYWAVLEGHDFYLVFWLFTIYSYLQLFILYLIFISIFYYFIINNVT